jgi:hypothetical protein
MIVSGEFSKKQGHGIGWVNENNPNRKTMTEVLGAGKRERSAERLGYRSGY